MLVLPCLTQVYESGIDRDILFLLVLTLTLVMCALPVQRYSDLSVCGCAPLVPIHVHVHIHVHVTNDGFRTQLVYVFTLFYNLKIMGKPA